MERFTKVVFWGYWVFFRELNMADPIWRIIFFTDLMKVYYFGIYRLVDHKSQMVYENSRWQIQYHQSALDVHYWT